MNKDDLIAFESEIADLFNAGKIPYPIHLESGNEDALIGIFTDIGLDDYICCSWRSHLKCLLKGVPPDELKAAIMRGESMSLCFPEHRVYSSAIVGGTVPIAVGIALAIKRRGGPERVHCFMGDMTARTGIAHESMEYGRDLPIRWVLEDNMVSVCTPTEAVWPEGDIDVVSYRYQSKYPHAGTGTRIQF